MIYKEKGKVTAVLAWTSTLFKSYLAIKLTNFPLGRSRQFCPEQKNLSLDIMSPNIFSTFLNRRTEGINRLLITWEKRFEEYTSSIVVMSFLKIFCMKISCIASWCTKVRHNRLTGSAELRVDLQERNISSYKSGRMFVGLRLFDRYCFVCLIGIVSFVRSFGRSMVRSVGRFTQSSVYLSEGSLGRSFETVPDSIFFINTVRAMFAYTATG